MTKLNTYLVQALREYRIESEGQFGNGSSSSLVLTQDAADAIIALDAEVEKLTNENELLKDKCNALAKGIQGMA